MNKRPNTNLMPVELMISYIKDLIIIKAVIIIAVSLVITLGVKFGADMYVKNTEKRTTNLESEVNSTYKSQHDVKQKEIDDLTVTLNAEETTVQNRQNTITNYELDKEKEEIEFTSTNVINFLDYVLANKSSTITIIKVEDNKTYDNYNTSGAKTGIEEVHEADDLSEAVFDTNNPDGYVEQSREEETQEKTSNYLKFTDEIDSYTLIIQGFAPDKVELSTFLSMVDSYEDVTSYNIIGIEKVDIADYSINLFEVRVVLR